MRRPRLERRRSAERTCRNEAASRQPRGTRKPRLMLVLCLHELSLTDDVALIVVNRERAPHGEHPIGIREQHAAPVHLDPAQDAGRVERNHERHEQVVCRPRITEDLCARTIADRELVRLRAPTVLEAPRRDHRLHPG